MWPRPELNSTSVIAIHLCHILVVNTLAAIDILVGPGVAGADSRRVKAVDVADIRDQPRLGLKGVMSLIALMLVVLAPK